MEAVVAAGAKLHYTAVEAGAASSVTKLTVDLQGHVTQARLVEPSQLTIHSERDPDPPAAQRRAATLALERAALAIARRCTLPPVVGNYAPATAVLPFHFDLE